MINGAAKAQSSRFSTGRIRFECTATPAPRLVETELYGANRPLGRGSIC